MERAIKTRIYPTEEQKILINKTFGSCRFVYNKALEKQIERHTGEKKFIGKYEMCRWITEIKQVYDWLYDVDSRALQLSAACLESAYKKFFKGAGFPKFKNKRSKQSYTTDSAIRVEPHYTRVPKIGLIRTYERLDENIKPNSITISIQAGLYFASIQYDDSKKPAEPNNGTKIGVDLGVKDLATFSDGTVIPKRCGQIKHSPSNSNTNT